MPKIAVYTIALNEEKHVKRWYESAKDADLLLIADTGSTDKTVEIAESLGITVHRISVDPWRFDVARNASLQLIPKDFDWCINMDMDEVLGEGWRGHFDSIPEIATRLRYTYWIGVDAQGNPSRPTLGGKIARRTGYRWKRAVHEVLVPIGEEVEYRINLEILHFPDKSKSRGHYLELLSLAHQEEPEDAQACFWFGRELFFNGRLEHSTKIFLKFLNLETSWVVERMATMIFMSKIQIDKAEYWLLRSCAETPFRREPWMELAEFYHSRKRWLLSLAAAQTALDITNKPLDYLSEEKFWGSRPNDLAALSAHFLGLDDIAIDRGLKALELSPEDLRLNRNLIYYFKQAFS